MSDDAQNTATTAVASVAQEAATTAAAETAAAVVAVADDARREAENTVTAAETAVALATATAAAAEQQAAETVRQTVNGLEQWQSELMARMEAQEAATAEIRTNFVSIAETLQSLNRPASPAPAETPAAVDPAVVANSEATREGNEGQEQAPRKPKKRWI